MKWLEPTLNTDNFSPIPAPPLTPVSRKLTVTVTLQIWEQLGDILYAEFLDIVKESEANQLRMYWQYTS
jgi:hypothetical protein